MTKKLNIIFKDKDVLVVDKPAGKPTLPDETYRSGTLLEKLLSLFPDLRGVNERGGILHRLDKDTSGLILVARNKQAFSFLKEAFQKRKIVKKYLALSSGVFKEKKGRIETFIGRSPKNRKKQKSFLLYEPQAQKKGLRLAVTEYKRLKSLKDGENSYTLLEVLPRTGRKHQIRVHLAHINHAISGDKTYGFKSQPIPKGLKRHFLHAFYLRFRLPGGQEKEFYSPLPEDLKRTMEQMAETP